MPVVSKAQNRFFRWAQEHPKESGVSPKVSGEFVSSMHGKSLKGLPERVKKQDGGAADPLPDVAYSPEEYHQLYGPNESLMSPWGRGGVDLRRGASRGQSFGPLGPDPGILGQRPAGDQIIPSRRPRTNIESIPPPLPPGVEGPDLRLKRGGRARKMQGGGTPDILPERPPNLPDTVLVPPEKGIEQAYQRYLSDPRKGVFRYPGPIGEAQKSLLQLGEPGSTLDQSLQGLGRRGMRLRDGGSVRSSAYPPKFKW
jgi:hypothetical protein